VTADAPFIPEDVEDPPFLPPDPPEARHERMVAAAVYLARQGFARIGWADVRDGKGPRRAWKSDATDDPALVPGLLAGARNALVIPTGRAIVIDIDQPDAWAELEAAGLPTTLAIDSPTPGHGHVYGWVPADVDMATIPGTFAGGEIRRHDPRTGTASMVLGPWSRRPDGVYTPRGGQRAIAELPASVIEHLIANARRQASERTAARGPDDAGWVITTGRHDFLVARARNLRGVGLTGERLLEELVRIDAERCRPPLQDVGGRGLDELRRIAGWTEQRIADDPPGVRLDAGPGSHASRNGHLPADPPAWRTLADVSDDPPAPLLFGMLEQGPTLAYAAPGVGKGTTGAWLVCQALEAGMRPLVFDAERRPREWARRVSGLGGDRSRVVYLEPTDLGAALAGRPFWEIADAVAGVVSAAGCDLFLLDSLLPASGIGEDKLRSDAQSPFLFVGALDRLGVTSLAFGHPPKGQPEGDPFGSMAWLAAFRMTWLGTIAEGDGHRIRWRPRKRNERGHIPGVLLTVTYGDDGRPCQVDRSDDDESTRDWLLAALVHGPRKVVELADEMLDDIASPPAGEAERVRERLGRMLRRMAKEGWVTREGPATGSNVRWALRLSE